MSDDDVCGYETAAGTPCQHPTTDDGDPDRCWVSAHNDAPTESGDPGRKWSIDESDHDAILDAARSGLSKAGCARAAGVEQSSLHRYLKAHDEFRNTFARARARGEQVLAESGLHDPDVDSSMAKFLLSTSFGYVKTERKEVDADVNQSGSLDVTINREVVESDDGDD